MGISDWSSAVCSSDLAGRHHLEAFVIINVEHAVELGEPEQHPVFERQRPARQRGARSARHHFHALGMRSEEHTSELQSLMRISYAVFCLKKKTSRRRNRPRQHTCTVSNTTPSSTNKRTVIYLPAHCQQPIHEYTLQTP